MISKKIRKINKFFPVEAQNPMKILCKKAKWQM